MTNSKSFITITTLLSLTASLFAAEPKTRSIDAGFLKPFPENVDRLPKNYRGVDEKKFLSLFMSRTAKLKRGEFEKHEDYLSRTSDLASVLAPISTELTYAFRVEDVNFSYDPDTETFNTEKSAACQDRTRTEGVPGQITCRLSPLNETERTYLASNAYGAQTRVSSFVGTYFGVSIKAKSPIVDGFIGEKDFPNGKWTAIRDKFSVPLEKARKIGTKSIATIIVGRVTGSQIINGPETHSRPTIDFPFENKRQTFAIPFDASEVIFYVPATGEILHRKKGTTVEGDAQKPSP